MQIKIHPDDLENAINKALSGYDIVNYNNPDGIGLKLHDVMANGNIGKGKNEVKLLAGKIFRCILEKSWGKK